MSLHARVLIVDSSRESREILRTLLQRQGAQTLEAAGARRANELALHEQPDVIVFDEDSDRSPRQEATYDLGATASRRDIPIVVLGTVRRCLSPFPVGELVKKPYHYGPLIRRIEELLGE
ncbi:MAG: hypothetical protein MI725_17195 [Pirellulales bacterium]|nr:hypothetical protein [Pirellulales bacterium]